ncbi:MAG: YihY/virulence factor BrkB family protein [Kineosporiaceae bacterium]
MSTATRVPETACANSDDLTADDAAAVLRRVGRVRLVKDSYARFRYGDGYSSSRALGYQFVLSFVPLVIAFVGLSSVVHADRVAETLRRTLLSLTPGSSSDAVEQALSSGAGGSGGLLALVAGLVSALVAMTLSMAQVERGANRIYGVQRDRPAKQRYGRAAVLALAAGVPSMIGFLVLVAGGAAIDAAAQVYGLGDGTTTTLQVLRWPVGAALDLVAITALFRLAPRRRQPGPTWLVIGAGTALGLWLLLSGALALYVKTSSSFGQVYGPLTGIIALLLWANLTSVALLLGVAFAAQLEAVHAGVDAPVVTDPEQRPGQQDSPVVVLSPPRTLAT